MKSSPDSRDAGESRIATPQPAGGAEAPVRIFWLLWGDKSVGSSRVNGYLPHHYLRRHHVRSVMLLAPSRLVPDAAWEDWEHHLVAKLVGSGIVVFQKMAGPRTEHLLRVLHNSGATSVYVQGDYYPDVYAPFLCDVIVCDATKLMEFYRSGGAQTLVYIPDSTDFVCERSEIARRPRRSQGLKICWHGSPDRWGEFTAVKEILQEPEFADMQLVTVSGHPEAVVKWSVKNLRQAMRDCDIGIVPKGPWAEAVYKPSDRAVQFMAAGVPVIAERIPSYEEVIVPGETGYLADNKEEYRAAFRALRDPEARLRIALRAYDSIQNDFPVEATGRKWLTLFQSIQAKKDQAKMPRLLPGRAEARLRNDLIIRAKVRQGREAFNRFQYLCAVQDFSVAAARLLLHPTLFRTYFAPLSRGASRVQYLISRRLSSRVAGTPGRR